MSDWLGDKLRQAAPALAPVPPATEPEQPPEPAPRGPAVPGGPMSSQPPTGGDFIRQALHLFHRR